MPAFYLQRLTQYLVHIGESSVRRGRPQANPRVRRANAGPHTQLASPTSMSNTVIILGLPGHTTVYSDPQTPQFYLSISLPTLSFQHLPSHSDPQFSSVAHLCPTLCHPMDCSMPGFPVHHHLPELAQTHVRRVSDAIQPYHPLSSPSPPAFNLPQHQGLLQCQFFASSGQSIGISASASVLPVNIQD